MSTPDEIHRLRLDVHYDGRDFFGWQLQASERTVQGELERVLGRLLNRPVRIAGSGRTDRGVHATGQVAAVDAPVRWEPERLRRAMNALLPPDVWIAAASIAAPDFHPRFQATSRSYLYRVGIADVCHSPLHAPWCWPVGAPLDEGEMRRATAEIVGDHSFLAFAKAGQEERGDRCMVTAAAWERWDDLGLTFHVTANRFLHHMVRYLVGTLVAVGRGVRPAEDLRRLLRSEPGLRTSPPAPPQGLVLSHVAYPGE